MRLKLTALILAVTLTGCATESIDREGKLLTLAAAEAQQISDPTERLTRQLNFANRQLEHGKLAESRQSLAYAAKTLREAKPADLFPQIRIAGWVSISELSRQNNDRGTAQMACDQAVATLIALDKVAERPDFVIGVANEVEALKGKPAAAKLLEQSGPWIKQIEGLPMQRAALVAVSDAIFNDDDFDGGLAMLRTDTDATWRSDALSMLAGRDATFRDANGNIVANGEQGSRTLDYVANVGNAAVPGSANSSRCEPLSVTQTYGKPVDFRSVFQKSK